VAVNLECKQESCRWCFVDNRYNGVLVCTHHQPTLIPHQDMLSFMLKCNTYKYRLPGDKLSPLTPINKDTGLYPGQIERKP
jgi:hypothetical protein